jgi:hypothetical protein
MSTPARPASADNERNTRVPTQSPASSPARPSSYHPTGTINTPQEPPIRFSAMVSTSSVTTHNDYVTLTTENASEDLVTEDSIILVLE